MPPSKACSTRSIRTANSWRPEKYKELQNDTQGAFGGLGIVISMKDNFITVVAPMEDSPGFKAGIMSGDRIIKIEGKSTEKMSLQEAVKYLRGEPGTEVSISLLRPSSGKLKDYKLTRAVINVDMVKDINGKKEFPLGDNKIGYIRLVQFGEKTSADLEAALKKLKAQGMQALVLDLRWNPGGLLDQAVDVCEKFLPRGDLVVTTEGRNPSQNSVRKARGRGDELNDMPMVVLVNLGSASASEIVAGCLQDSKRAIVLGEKTFGKGSVQSIIPLAPCRTAPALRLTTAKYYTPSHKVIHEEGITPDILVPLTEEQERDVQLKHMPRAASKASMTRTASEWSTAATRNSNAPWTCSRASRSSPSAPPCRTRASRAPKRSRRSDTHPFHVSRFTHHASRLQPVHEPTVRVLHATSAAKPCPSSQSKPRVTRPARRWCTRAACCRTSSRRKPGCTPNTAGSFRNWRHASISGICCR